MIELNGINVKLTKDIGEINTKRKEAITNILEGRFEKIADTPDNFLILYDPAEEKESSNNVAMRNGIAIDDDSLSFFISENVNEKLESGIITEIADMIFDTLLVEKNNLEIVTDFVASYSAKGSSFEKSLELFCPNGISFPDVKGMGLRFFVDNEKYYGEYKIEPYVNTPENFFINEEVMLKNKIPLTELNEYLVEVKNDIVSRTRLLLSE